MTREQKRATILALGLILSLVFGLALTARGDHADGGTDLDWVQAMNHPDYWETYFGPGAECRKFEDHNGWIPAGYDAAVVKDGTRVRVYDQAGPFQASGPVNPANGKHHKAPHSWVTKCKIDPPETTTTTVPEVTTTTEGPPPTEPSTTTTVPEVTTTQPETTTTTVPETTTTTPDSSTTAPPPPSTTEPEPDPQPSIVPDDPADPATPELKELPFTGPAEVAGLLGLASALAGGGLALLRASRRRGE